MFICLSCGEVFEIPLSFSENHGPAERPYIELACVCPKCGEGDYEPTMFCHSCDTLIPSSYESDRFGLCEPCENAALQRFRDCIGMFTPYEIKYINDYCEGRDLVEEWRNL